MSKLIRNTQKKFAKMERGQVLVVVALSAVVLIAIIGLAMDVGVMFIGNARLRRAVDSAALGAALQVREGYTLEKLTDSATEFLILNGITLNLAHPVTVDTCDTVPSLCYDAINHVSVPRKLVRVTASATIQLAFLPVIGINTVNISATATSEAASVDVVLVIDRSESMANTPPDGDQKRDPSYCNTLTPPSPDQNNVGDCEPFNTVKDAAIGFVDQLFFPYDRVAIVSFARDPDIKLHFVLGADGVPGDCPHPATPCTEAEIKANIISTIQQLTVYSGDESIPNPALRVYPNGTPSRYYDPVSGSYLGMYSTLIYNCTPWNCSDPSPSNTTNIGTALLVAGDEFAQPPIRQQALWVVVLLTDGMANRGVYSDINGNPVTTCPRDTWPDQAVKHIYCNDGLSATRHPMGNGEYDADDYAYDMADFVGLPADQGGQNALIFSIGLGKTVRDPNFLNPDGTYTGEAFLHYAATVGRGIYYYSPDAAALREIFRKIGDNIATRLTH